MPVAVVYLDAPGRAWREGVAEVIEGRVLLRQEQPAPELAHLDGVITGAFTDAHVHLQLVDIAELADSTLGRVFDLGGDPDALADLRHNSGMSTQPRTETTESARIRAESQELCRPCDLEIGFAGAFLTPPGGYPSDRSWAPAGSVREIADADAAAAAIAEMKRAGATCIKVASNSTAGPVFSDEMFTTIVEIASSRSLSVIAHAEGPGEAQRATRLGARMLAHAPFTERLSDSELHAMHGSVAWASTLAIHDGEAYDIAVDNVRRFHALGGNIAYGTDMGNGPTPAGLSPREIAGLREAGIDGVALLRALVPVDPTNSASRLLFYPGCTPETADPLRARLLTPADLED